MSDKCSLKWLDRQQRNVGLFEPILQTLQFDLDLLDVTFAHSDFPLYVGHAHIEPQMFPQAFTCK